MKNAGSYTLEIPVKKMLVIYENWIEKLFLIWQTRIYWRTI
jgi:hypothetical protein